MSIKWKDDDDHDEDDVDDDSVSDFTFRAIDPSIDTEIKAGMKRTNLLSFTHIHSLEIYIFRLAARSYAHTLTQHEGYFRSSLRENERKAAKVVNQQL